MTSQQLYEALTHCRHELPQFLMQYKCCDYAYLSNLFAEITQSKDDSCVLRKLLHGLEGYEHNKQMALYSIPTVEFMSMIYSLQVLTDRYNVVELFSGMSLFSGIYTRFAEGKEISNYPKTNVTALDSNTWLETSNEHKYFQTEKCSIEKCITNHPDLNSSVCVAIFPHKFEQFLPIFFDTCHPDSVVVVIPKSDTETYMALATGTLYKALCVNPKLITYLDYCYLPDGLDVRHSRTIIYTKTDVHERSLQIISNEILQYNCKIMMEEQADSATEITHDCISINLFPLWMCHLNVNEKNEALSELQRVHNVPKMFIMIRDNIKNMDELREYLTWKPSPPLACVQSRFNEFRNLYRRIGHEGELEKMKNECIFPEWIRTIDDAYDYLYLDYDMTIEDPNKLWKENENAFHQYIENMSQMLVEN